MVLTGFAKWLFGLVGGASTAFGIYRWAQTDEASAFLIEVALLGVSCYVVAFALGAPAIGAYNYAAEEHPEYLEWIPSGRMAAASLGAAFAVLVVLLGIAFRVLVMVDDVAEDMDGFATLTFSVIGALLLLATLFGLYLVTHLGPTWLREGEPGENSENSPPSGSTGVDGRGALDH